MLFYFWSDSTPSKHYISVCTLVFYEKYRCSYTLNGYYNLEYYHLTDIDELVEALIFKQSMEFLWFGLNCPLYHLFLSNFERSLLWVGAVINFNYTSTRVLAKVASNIFTKSSDQGAFKDSSWNNQRYVSIFDILSYSHSNLCYNVYINNSN